MRLNAWGEVRGGLPQKPGQLESFRLRSQDFETLEQVVQAYEGQNPPRATFQTLHRLQAGDVLVARYTRPLRCAVVTPLSAGVLAEENLAVVRPRLEHPETARFSSEFVAFYLTTGLAQAQLESEYRLVHGTHCLTVKALANILLPKTSLERQTQCLALGAAHRAFQRAVLEEVAAKQLLVEAIFAREVGGGSSSGPRKCLKP